MSELRKPNQMRYFLSQDNDCHWYVIPADKRDEWNAWCEIDPDDDLAWDPPSFAKPINGSPTLVTFSDPEIE